MGKCVVRAIRRGSERKKLDHVVETCTSLGQFFECDVTMAHGRQSLVLTTTDLFHVDEGCRSLTSSLTAAAAPGGPVPAAGVRYQLPPRFAPTPHP